MSAIPSYEYALRAHALRGGAAGAAIAQGYGIMMLGGEDVADAQASLAELLAEEAAS